MSPSEENNDQASLQSVKKTYESPAWEVEKVFETTAAVMCAKESSGTCAAGPIQS